MNKILSDENERLFRKIPDNPIMFKSDGKISSAVFKDSKGCSVDKQGERETSKVYSNFIARFDNNSIVAVADITNKNCMDVDAPVFELPEDDNPYHCEIHGSTEKATLTKSQARQLSKISNVYHIN